MTGSASTRRVYSRDDDPPSLHPSYLAWVEAHPHDTDRVRLSQVYLMLRAPDEPLTDEALDLVEHFYTETPVPPCRVCGRELLLGSSGSQRTWYCSRLIRNPDKHKPDDPDLIVDPEWDPMNTSYGLSLHHVWSEIAQEREGDALALRLVREIRRLRQVADDTPQDHTE